MAEQVGAGSRQPRLPVAPVGGSRMNGLADILPPGVDPEAAGQMVGVALRLAGILHDEDPAEAAALVASLTASQQHALPFVLAAMIDVERTPAELLGWCGYRPSRRLRNVTAVAPGPALTGSGKQGTQMVECGTYRAWLRHVDRGEPIDTACGIAAAAWRRMEQAEQVNGAA